MATRNQILAVIKLLESKGSSAVGIARHVRNLLAKELVEIKEEIVEKVDPKEDTDNDE